MKTDTHFWSYLAQFFLSWEMFQTNVEEKIKTRFMFHNFFFRKSWGSWDNVEKHDRAGQATDENTCIILRTRITWEITKATNTYLEYVIIIVFPRQQWLHKSATMLRCKYTVLSLVGTLLCQKRPVFTAYCMKGYYAISFGEKIRHNLNYKFRYGVEWRVPLPQ
jgi:hypothetical protein